MSINTARMDGWSLDYLESRRKVFDAVALAAQKYGASVGIDREAGTAIILYQMIGHGTLISGEIEAALPKDLDYNLKMTPSMLRLEFKVL